MALEKYFMPWVSRPADQVFWCSSYGPMVEQAAENRPNTGTDRVTMDWEATTGISLPYDPFEMDILEMAAMLPSDPFGMDTATSVAISDLVSGLFNLVPGSGTSSSSVMMYVDHEIDAFDASQEMMEVPIAPVMYVDHEIDVFDDDAIPEMEEEEFSIAPPAPVVAVSQVPEGMAYALGYLGLKDLLAVEQACRDLRDAVRGEPLLWMSIHIDSALSGNVDDETLLRVTRKAQGNLRELTLESCLKVTDEGLRCVLEENPFLTKLSVPGCWKLTLDGLIRDLKAFNSKNIPGIKHLRLGRLFGMSEIHFSELTSLLNYNPLLPNPSQKPHFYHISRSCMKCNEDRAFDIDVCPVCEKYLLVYDCPLESCKGKRVPCRACESCIFRCMTCGKCIRDDMYTETFSLEYLCESCFKLASVE